MIEDFHDPEVLRRLYWEEGLSINQIAERLYACPTTIRAHLMANHIERRPRGGKRKVSGPKPKLVRVGSEMLSIREISQRAGISWDTAKHRVELGYTGDMLLGPSRQGKRQK